MGILCPVPSIKWKWQIPLSPLSLLWSLLEEPCSTIFLVGVWNTMGLDWISGLRAHNSGDMERDLHSLSSGKVSTCLTRPLGHKRFEEILNDSVLSSFETMTTKPHVKGWTLPLTTHTDEFSESVSWGEMHLQNTLYGTGNPWGKTLSLSGPLQELPLDCTSSDSAIHNFLWNKLVVLKAGWRLGRGWRCLARFFFSATFPS